MPKTIFIPKTEATDVISIRVPASCKKRWDALVPAVTRAGGDLRETAKAELLALIDKWEDALKALTNGHKEGQI